MSLADKNVFLCTCNGTMPLDATRSRGARAAGAAAVHTVMCQRELAHFAGQRGAATWSSRARRSSGCWAKWREEARQGAAIRFVNIRETGGWSAEARARDAQDRGAAGDGRAARARARAERQLQVAKASC